MHHHITCDEVTYVEEGTLTFGIVLLVSPCACCDSFVVAVAGGGAHVAGSGSVCWSGGRTCNLHSVTAWYVTSWYVTFTQ